MPTESKPIVEQTPSPGVTLADFLESHPPGQVVKVTDLAVAIRNIDAYNLALPELQLHCAKERCNGIRVFRCTSSYGPRLSEDGFRYEFVNYQCSNCQEETKTFSLAIRKERNALSGNCYKFGELPNFGPATPARLIRLIQNDRDVFLKGRRCENQGLGIGAFVYYRRVVENQKNRILEEIKRVLQKLGAKPEVIVLLDQAIAENQFQKAMQIAKDGIPESLLIDGHNPLGLLHSALSEGVHNLNDEECLDLASSIRVVLTELSERLAQALKDEAELTKAVGKLLNRKK
jgi:hypothetical protein